MKRVFVLIFACIAFGCDAPTNSTPDAPTSSTQDDGERVCEVEGFEHSLATTVDELENKSGDDLVRLTQSTIVVEKPEDLTDEELVEFYTNEDNFAETTHEVPFSRIIKCRTGDELVEYYLEKD